MQPILFQLESPKPSERQSLRGVSFIEARSILSKATGMIDWFDFTINPYHGCRFGCSYCYAAFFEPNEERVKRWGEWVDAKVNAFQLIKRAKGVEGARILVGSVTDPYQPIEVELELTRSILDHLATRQPQPQIYIITRSPFAERDIDVFLKFEKLRVSMSITTDDDEVRKRYEPSCASIDRRFSAIKAIAAAGIDAGISVAPTLPIRNPKRFAERILDAGVQHYYAGFFHETRRRFAAGTRPEALRLAREDGWNEVEFCKVRAELKHYLKDLNAAPKK